MAHDDLRPDAVTLPSARPAVVIRRIGPYHRARMRALQARAGAALALEVCAQDLTYSWEMQPSEDAFDRVTLFSHEEDITAVALGAAIRAALDEWRPDLVAVPGWGDAAAFFAMDWAHYNRVPIVLMSDSRAEDAVRNPVAEAIKRLVVGNVSGGLVAGQAHAAYLEALGMDPGRIATGYDVVDNAHFAEGAAATRADTKARARLCLPERYILVLSRFVPKKNLSALLAAYARFRADTFGAPDLVIAGDGPEEARLRAEAGDGVIFRHFARYDEVPALLALAEGLVLASEVEQWGLVVNEAMAAGCPVLVSRKAGAAELVRDGETGFLADPDAAGLAAGLTRLVTADRAALVRAAEIEIARWGPERFAEGLLCLASQSRTPGRLKAAALSPVLRTLAAWAVGAGAGA